jgi:hypothetical protein
MFFPLINPGQMCDEAVGLASGGAVFQDLTAAAYTVPAGMTLLIHGWTTLGANVASTIVIGGVTVYSATPSAGFATTCVDRYRTYAPNAPAGGAAAFGGLITNSVVTTTPTFVGYFFAASATAGIVVAEHAPFLFWPIAAGLTVQVTGAGTHFMFWGTLIPT